MQIIRPFDVAGAGLPHTLRIEDPIHDKPLIFQLNRVFSYALNKVPAKASKWWPIFPSNSSFDCPMTAEPLSLTMDHSAANKVSRPLVTKIMPPAFVFFVGQKVFEFGQIGAIGRGHIVIIFLVPRFFNLADQIISTELLSRGGHTPMVLSQMFEHQPIDAVCQ
uniref:Uncharacterized protein n=1 Tax=Romanomermis culicivorax TaxID=13658 RepID=A0A915IG27_ROMCU